jgi:hypothetical protein
VPAPAAVETQARARSTTESKGGLPSKAGGSAPTRGYLAKVRHKLIGEQIDIWLILAPAPMLFCRSVLSAGAAGTNPWRASCFARKAL